MYSFAGGKDADVSVATFLPAWWFDNDGEPAPESREAKMAKFARLFSEMGGQPVGDGG